MSEPDELNGEQRQRLRALLDHGAENLDANTVSRLAQARTRALRGETVARAASRWLVPAVGTAVAASIVAVVALQVLQQPAPGTADVAVTDMELLTAQDDLEFYEDLEFYRWLEHENREG